MVEKVKKNSRAAVARIKKRSAGGWTWIKKHWLFCILALAAVVVLVGSIAGVVWFYRDRAAPGTTVAGTGVGGQTSQQLLQTIAKLEKQIKLEVSHDKKTVTASVNDLGITIDSKTTAAAAVKTGQQNFFAVLFAHQKLDLIAKFNAKSAREFITRNFPELTTDPVDAQVVFDGNQGGFVVQPGAAGQSIDLGNLDLTITDLIKRPRTAKFAIKINDAPPVVSNAAAEKSAEAANTRLALALRIINNGRVIWTIDPPDIAAWTTFTANAESGRYDITYDKAKIADFINNQVASQVSNKPVNEQVIADAGGNILRVVSPGRNGQAPTNVNQIAGQIAVALNNAVAEDFNLATNDAPFKTDKIVALNNRWVEANLSDYSVRLYEGAEVVWQTSQTAHGKASTPTITGLFKVFSKVYQQCMPNPPSPDPLCNIHYVTYWGPGGYAFHEAWWMQTSQIGTGISHGCVNMRLGDAKMVYDFTTIGTPVWVHY